jgi:phage host-nuclease inhibitor protein Gam
MKSKTTTKVPAAKKQPKTLEEKVYRYQEIYTENETLAAKYQALIEGCRKEYQPRFDELKAEAETLATDIQADCEAKREKLFANGAKSIRIGRVVISFRSGVPSLQLTEGKSWDEALKLALKHAAEYVVHKPQLDKNGLKSLNNTSRGQKLLEKLGLCVKTEEAFSIDVKEEKV